MAYKTTYKELLKEIKKDKLIDKYLYNNIWLSGCNTYVYPITIWETSKKIYIQINTKKNYFKKLIDRYKNKYDIVAYCYFDKTDETCPSCLVFQLKHNVKIGG